VSRPDQLLPLLVMDVAGQIPGFTGLFVAGVFSAALRYLKIILFDYFEYPLPHL
jgi:hypothetical protein